MQMFIGYNRNNEKLYKKKKKELGINNDQTNINQLIYFRAWKAIAKKEEKVMLNAYVTLYFISNLITLVFKLQINV